MNKRIRVVQYGVGPIGARIVQLMAQKPALEIVGAIDVDPQKAGRDLGEVAGVGRSLGVKVSADAAAVLGAGVDVVVHTTSSLLTQVAEQLKQCMAAGAHVVSTCEELSYPFLKHPDLSRELDGFARQHKVALLGTGVNPGYAMDKLVLTLSAAAARVDAARAVRIVDASKRRLPLQKKIGAGMTVEEFNRQVAAGVIKHHGLPESVGMVADGLGLRVDDIREVIQPVVAEERVKTEFLEVQPGEVAGVHQIARGVSNGQDKIFLELKMYVGAKDPSDTAEVIGQPNLKLTIPGGIHGDIATAAVAVNCIPLMRDVPPGLRTAKDIPMSYLPQ